MYTVVFIESYPLYNILYLFALAFNICIRINLFRKTGVVNILRYQIFSNFGLAPPFEMAYIIIPRTPPALPNDSAINV